MSEENEDAKKWYVVNVYTGYENKVKEILQEKIRQNKLEKKLGEILVPTETTKQILSNGKQRNRTKSTFPGYVFVQTELTDQVWHIIKSIPKVTRFVGDKQPQEISKIEIAKMRGEIVKGVVKPKISHKFQTGDEIRIIDGAFENFPGKITEINAEKQKVKVIVNIFGRETPIELEFKQVVKA